MSLKPTVAHSIFYFGCILTVVSCGGNGNPSAAARDTDSQIATETSDTDTADTASEAGDSEPVTACLDSISGRVVIEGADPLPVSVIVCIGTCFAPIPTDAAGGFEWHHPIGGDFDCIPYPFERLPLHMDFRVTGSKEFFAEYAFLMTPTQTDISDQGEDDYDLDLGDIMLYALPDEIATFSPTTGAAVSLFGVSFTLDKDSLVKAVAGEEVVPKQEQAIHVFKAPLDEWAPPFSTETLSALYFLGPRWARLGGGGVPLTIEASPDLSDGDTVHVYLLGSYSSEWGDEAISDRPDFIYLDAEGHCINDNGAADLDWVADGIFQDCGTAVVENGRITTPPVPRLTWVGIGR